jgi:hypothetical protein
MHIAQFFVAPGDSDWAYATGIAIRIAGELFLAAVVIRDILSPWHDPVRMDGLSDDPLGGILDEGIDNETLESDDDGYVDPTLGEQISVYGGRGRHDDGRRVAGDEGDGDDGDDGVPGHSDDPDRDPIYAG